MFMPPQIRLAANTNTYLPCMSVYDALDFIRGPMDLHFVEFSAVPNSSYVLWGGDAHAFSRVFSKFAGYAQGIGLYTPVVSSWIRDNRDIALNDPDLHKAGVDVLRCLIDIGEIMQAERVMSPAGTIRGYHGSAQEWDACMEQILKGWKAAAEYAKGKVRGLEFEQMSWKDDPPQDFEQADRMLKQFREWHSQSSGVMVPLSLRYDVGHGPSPPPVSGDCPEYHPINWFHRYPGEILGAHLKGTDRTRTAVLPLLNDPQYWDGELTSGRIVTSLLDAIESPESKVSNPFDLVVETGMMSERAHKIDRWGDRPPFPQLMIDSVQYVKQVMGERGYTEQDGLWTKINQK